TGLAAIDLLSILATEKDAAMKAAEESGLSRRAFAVSWSLKNDAALKAASVSSLDLAREAETISKRFPNATVNPDEQRRFRAALYRPLLKLPTADRMRIVDQILATLLG